MKKGKTISPTYPCMAKDKVVYAGQSVAAVVAINQDIAEAALELIEVDYEILTPVTNIIEAMKPDAPIIHPKQKPNLDAAGKPEKDTVPSNIARHAEYGRGDVEAGFKKADIILENTYHTQRVHQGYLEPRVAVASVGLDGKVTLWTDSQGIFKVREFCAYYLDLPVSKIRVMPVEVGGAFGGKNSQPLSPTCALLAMKAKRPVKMVLTREEDFIDTRPAPPSTITVKLGADKEGRLTAASVTLIFDSGAFYGELPMAMGGSINALSPYTIPNFKVDCYDVFTNKTPTGSYRAPNTPQSAFAMESQLDLLARALNMDPLELRLKNASAEGDLMSNGAVFTKIGFKETLEKMKQHLATRSKPEGKNQGRGIACGLWRGGVGGSAAIVNANADGRVTLVLGSTDITGSHTSLSQMVAEEFGIPFEEVTVVSGDTDTAPYGDNSAGSKNTHQMGTAVCRVVGMPKGNLFSGLLCN